MKRTLVIGLAVVAVVLLVAVGMYNRVVTLDTGVSQAWGQVENVLQRRMDLIPNLVSVVKAYAKHERELFVKVAEARQAYAGARTISEKAQAATQVEGLVGRLLAIAENYPTLRASENFSRLQDELAGTENRIAVERMRYNDAVGQYNATIRRFPTVFLARMFGFASKTFFEAAPGAKTVPDVGAQLGR